MFNKNEFLKNQMKLCLNCTIGTQIISDYEALLKITTSSELDNEDRNLINDISNLLELPGDFDENYRLLKQLFSKNNFNEETTEPCLVNLQRIAVALKNTYSEYDENVAELHPYLKHILNTMHQQNKETLGLNYQSQDENTKALKLLSKNGKNDAQDEAVPTIAKGVKNIIRTYSIDHSRSYSVHNQGECFRKMFLGEVKKIDVEQARRKTDFFNRVDKLCSKSQIVIKEYITNIPKKFGYNLKIVMREQNMTEQDLKQLTGISVSAIQSLEKADIPQREQSDISLLCRALLVSEDVLYKGIGKRYGNWKDLFDNDSLKTIAKSTNQTRKNDTKKFIREEIQKLINLDDTDFKKLVQEYQDLFFEEDFRIFSDWKDYYDSLLHMEELFTLLEILEKTDM